MKRFIQYISEDFPMLEPLLIANSDWDFRQNLEKLSQLHSDPKTATEFSKAGEIGPYEVFHSKRTEVLPGVGYGKGRKENTTVHHAFVVHHEGKPVGFVPFKELEPGDFRHIGKKFVGKYLTTGAAPRFEHRGDISFVDNLPSRVYELAARHLDLPIVSDKTQSPGGRNIWRNIARQGTVSAVNRHASGWDIPGVVTNIPDYNPDDPEHEKHVYGETRDKDSWVLIHKPEK